MSSWQSIRKSRNEYSHLAVAVCEDQNDLLFQYPHSDACLPIAVLVVEPGHYSQYPADILAYPLRV